MSVLFVGLDHVATLRQAGGSRDPDPVIVAGLAELAGAGGLSLTIGRERNGMQERDVRLLRDTVRTVLNVCLPPLDEWVKLALAIRPDLVTLTSEGREAFGAERGLDVEDRLSELQPVIGTLRSGGIGVSILVEPAPAQVKAAHRAGAEAVLLHTGRYGWAGDVGTRAAEFERLVNASKIGRKLGLTVHAGGGLGYQSAAQVGRVPEIEAVHVGHSLIARAALVGVREAVRELLRTLAGGEGR
ncbi:MAG: pyridoxine 5'-phosphate synthase [candidate division NC10 bacterium]|nr:pyridoxine 5'-phosphate synthase [candidate division NC10 bacterium]